MSMEDRRAKWQKTDQTVTSSDESTTTDKAVEPADNDAKVAVGALDAIEQIYNAEDWRENWWQPCGRG